MPSSPRVGRDCAGAVVILPEECLEVQEAGAEPAAPRTGSSRWVDEAEAAGSRNQSQREAACALAGVQRKLAAAAMNYGFLG